MSYAGLIIICGEQSSISGKVSGGDVPVKRVDLGPHISLPICYERAMRLVLKRFRSVAANISHLGTARIDRSRATEVASWWSVAAFLKALMAAITARLNGKFPLFHSIISAISERLCSCFSGRKPTRQQYQKKNRRNYFLNHSKFSISNVSRVVIGTGISHIQRLSPDYIADFLKQFYATYSQKIIMRLCDVTRTYNASASQEISTNP